MRVVNKTKGIVLSENASLADTFHSRLKGLMFSKKKDLVIKASREGVMESSIHMMFMLQQIDAIWVNKNMKVVSIERKIKPHNYRKPETWRVYKPQAPALYIIELAVKGSARTEVGDVIAFE